MIPSRRQTDDCLSDLGLDRLMAGELPDEARADAERHLATCGACERRREELAADRAVFAASPVAALDSISGRSTRTADANDRSTPAPLPRSRWLAVAGGLALAASAVFALSRAGLDSAEPASSASDRGATTRAKGSGYGLRIVVRRGESTFESQAGDPLQPGDALRFLVSTPRRTHLTVFGRDATGKIAIYRPLGESEPAALPPGDSQLLEGAFRLDDVLGKERFLAVFCATPVPVERLKEALYPHFDDPAFPEGCQHELLTRSKVRP